MTEEMIPEIKEDSDHDALILAIEQRVGELLEKNRDLLLSSLYRMDVPEDKVKAALESADPISTLAQLILQRQLKRLEYKKKYSSRG